MDKNGVAIGDPNFSATNNPNNEWVGFGLSPLFMVELNLSNFPITYQPNLTCDGNIRIDHFNCSVTRMAFYPSGKR